MKWNMPNTTEKSTSFPNGSLSRTSTGQFISALIQYSMKKRKLENGENKQSGKQVLVSSNGQITVRQAKKIRNSITRKELSVIQTQLAILSDGDGDRPIHIAVANENTTLVHKLCLLMAQNSISLDLTNYLRQTPLHLAVMLGNTELIKLLLHYGASTLLSDRNGNSVLHLAVKSSCTKEVFDILLSHAQVKNILNSMDYEGYSPLHYAVFKNNSDAVQVLHSYGADMNKIDGKSGRTPLIHAVLDKNQAMVELLLNCGACPQKIDYSGRSALEMALQVTHKPIVKMLEKWIPQNEIPLVKDQTRTSPLHSAKKNKRTKDQN